MGGNLCRCATYVRIRAAIHEAAKSLASTQIGGRLCWLRLSSEQSSHEQGSLPAVYHEEMLPNVSAFLFAGSESGTCHYLKMTNDAIQTWFRDLEFEMRRGVVVRASIVARIGIEMFLTPYGTGILSITLSPDKKEMTPQEVLEFNYRTSRIHKRGLATLRSAVRAAPSSASDSNNAAVQDPPAARLPLEQRWGKAGGDYEMKELVETLLGPLKPFDLQFAQDSFSVFTVVRFDEQIDFESPEVVKRMSTFLSSLAQIEEPMHTGGVSGIVNVEHLMLNRRHWVASGMYGSAHIISDQPPPPGQEAHPFNQQRTHRVRDRYFIPYMLATLQRWSLQRFVFDAGHLAMRALQDPKVESEFQNLQRDLLRFAMDGHYTQVSSREAIHQYYRLARKGMDLAEIWREARQAIADNHARITMARQQEIAENMEQNTHVVAAVQNKIEWVEIVIMSVYAVELLHVLHEVSTENGYGLAVIVWVFAICAGILAALLLEPWHHWHGSRLRQFSILGALCLMPLAYLGIKANVPEKEEQQEESTDTNHNEEKSKSNSAE
jgi:hypothetical protein